MKAFLPLLVALLPLLVHAQTEDRFMVKKPEDKGGPKTERDTFMQRVFASTKAEMHNRIAYVTALQIENEQSLILFKATRGIMDTLTWFSDKNAHAGDWRKLKYENHNDTLYFTYTLTKPQLGNSKKMVTVTYSYIKRARGR